MRSWLGGCSAHVLGTREAQGASSNLRPSSLLPLPSALPCRSLPGPPYSPHSLLAWTPLNRPTVGVAPRGHVPPSGPRQGSPCAPPGQEEAEAGGRRQPRRCGSPARRQEELRGRGSGGAGAPRQDLPGAPRCRAAARLPPSPSAAEPPPAGPGACPGASALCNRCVVRALLELCSYSGGPGTGHEPVPVRLEETHENEQQAGAPLL